MFTAYTGMPLHAAATRINGVYFDNKYYYISFGLFLFNLGKHSGKRKRGQYLPRNDCMSMLTRITPNKLLQLQNKMLLIDFGDNVQPQ